MPSDRLNVLPITAATGPANMALDLLLLSSCGQQQPGGWFRHYDWLEPTWSFGFRQHLWQVNELLPQQPIQLVRRPTGGGIVDHRDDWTYALALSHSHPLATAPALQSYRAVHQAIIRAIATLDIAAELAPPPCSDELPHRSHHPSPPGSCFHRSECNDVVCPATKQKLAGAAQKRTRDGLLIQGSLRLHVPFDRSQLCALIAAEFAQMADLELATAATHPAGEEEIDVQTRKFADPQWTARR